MKMRKKRYKPAAAAALSLSFILIPVLISVLILASGCGTVSSSQAQDGSGSGTSAKEASGDIFAMDTYMTVTCCGSRCEEALEASMDEIRRLDDLLSVGKEESEVNTIRLSGGGILSPDLAAITEEALAIYEMTDGAFDFTVTPLMELWGFTGGGYHVPSEGELKEALQKTGSGRLTYDKADRRLTLGDGQAIDPGGIAKGYTSDRLMELFREYGLEAGLVSLGGNVQCYGTKPDGTYWRCGIRDPFRPDDSGAFLGIVEAADQAVITSGAYERYFTDETDGRTYHHILDPKTGCPADSGLVSATIVSGSGILADGLSTAVYVMGLEKAANLWRKYGSDFDMILMADSGEVYVTAPLAGRFSSDYPVTVLE